MSRILSMLCDLATVPIIGMVCFTYDRINEHIID